MYVGIPTVRLDQPADVLRSVTAGPVAKMAFLTEPDVEIEFGSSVARSSVACPFEEPDKVDDEGLPLEADGGTLIPCERKAENTEAQVNYFGYRAHLRPRLLRAGVENSRTLYKAKAGHEPHEGVGYGQAPPSPWGARIASPGTAQGRARTS